MRKVILPLTMLLFVSSWWNKTPNGFGQTFKADKPLGEVEQSMEANLNWNLQNALLLYYPETKFVVNTKVQLRKVTPKRTLPKLPDALLSKDLKNLPGLPYLPKDLGGAQAEEQTSQNLREQVDVASYRVNRVFVNVLVDQSLSDKDWAFIRRFTTMTANLEPARGDQVRIEALQFPSRSSFAAAQEEPGPDPPEPAPVTEPAPTTNEEQARDLFPYLFAAGLAVLLLIMFMVGQRSLAKQLNRKEGQQPQTPSPAPVAALQAPPQKEETQKSTTKETENAVVEVLKSNTIDSIVGAPAVSARVFNSWIDQNGDLAYVDISTIFVTVSVSLFDLVEPYFGQERSQEVHKQVALISEKDVQEKSEPLLKKFDEDIRRLALKEKFDEKEDALSFLHQMSDDQLQHLLKPLKTGVMAIVLAQLQSNRAAAILKSLELEERKAVLAAMGNIERIPADVYQHVARQLAGRAQELKRMRYVKADGVDALVQVMDHLDEETQSGTLDYLQTQDVALAKKVKNQFTTFDDLVKNPGDRLRQAALAVDRDVLATSLTTLDETDIEKIISTLPEKLGEMVRASLESKHDVSEKEVTEARRTVLRTLRNKKSPEVINA